MAGVVRGFGHAAYTQSTQGQDIPSHQVVVLGDGEGNLLVANGSPAVTVASAAQQASGTQTVSTAAYSSLAVDLDVTAFAGGTTPSITFTLSRMGSDGIAYPFWNSGAISSTPTKMSASFGAGFTGGTGGQGAGGFPVALTGSVQFAWTTTGAPTSVTFSASIVGH